MNTELLKMLKSRANIYHHDFIPSLAIELTCNLGEISDVLSSSDYKIYENGLLAYTKQNVLRYEEVEDNFNWSRKKLEEDIVYEVEYLLFPLDVEHYESKFGIDSVYSKF